MRLSSGLSNFLDEIPQWNADALFIIQITELDVNLMEIFEVLNRKGCYKSLVAVENQADHTIQVLSIVIFNYLTNVISKCFFFFA